MDGRIKRPQPGISRVAFPRVGSVKIGMKEVGRNGKEFPRSVDYFIPTGKYAALFTQAYGEKPSTIQIVFPDDDPAKVCNEMYEYRDDDGRRVAYGDGEIFHYWNGKEYIIASIADYPNLMAGVAKKYPNKAVRNGGDGWNVTLTLTFIAPLIRGVMGVWQFVSKGSASTIPNIRDAFDAMIQERGSVRGVVFDLNVQFAKTQKPGDNSRFPVVSLVPNESVENLQKIKAAYEPVKLLEDKKE